MVCGLAVESVESAQPRDTIVRTDGVPMSWPADRPRQFKLYLSDEEWERLEHITEEDGCSMADVIRGFIHLRYEELYGSLENPLAAADALVELARKLRSMAKRQKLSLGR